MSRNITQQVAEMIANEFGGELSSDSIIKLYDDDGFDSLVEDGESLAVTVDGGTEITIEAVPTEKLQRYSNVPLRDGCLAINSGRELRIRTFPLSKAADIAGAAQQ